ncbi:MAG: amino acid permease, partial [Candidatus Nanoarchaeia archaeon]|nr:amino acid permease [Candidatus Nanoarchaeia archaeon]
MTELKKSISFSVLILLAINAIIGTGIFFVPGIAAAIAGPASIVSWVAVAIIAMFVAACFAELVGMFPKAGGVYEYTKQAFGEFGGFMVGWIAWIVANVTIAMLSIGCLEYLAVFIDMSHITKTIIALFIVALVNFVSFRGIDLSV